MNSLVSRFVVLSLAGQMGCFAGPPSEWPTTNDLADPTPASSSEQSCKNASSQDCVLSCKTHDNCPSHQACRDLQCVDYSKQCLTAPDCLSGYYCYDFQCQKKLVTGIRCTGNEACQSNTCQNYCCDTQCQDTCFSCDPGHTQGEAGICAPIMKDLDPYEQCKDNTSCDGSGQCSAPVPEDCNQTNTCVKKPQGAKCEDPDECTSHFCVDGYCCDKPCDAPCASCKQNALKGQCLPLASTYDPGLCDPINMAGDCTSLPCQCDAQSVCRASLGLNCLGDLECASGRCLGNACCATACESPCKSCNSLHTNLNPGNCAPIISGQDPFNECFENTVCDGRGTCFSKTLGSQCDGDQECLSGHCVDRVCCNEVCQDTCRACDSVRTRGQAGTCAMIPVGTDPDAECEGIVSCNGLGQCDFKNTGIVCTLDYECLSRYCSDGYCCNERCDQRCKVCNNFLQLGTCSNPLVRPIGCLF